MAHIDRRDTQASILEGYRAKLSNHLFFRFRPDQGSQALTNLLPLVNDASPFLAEAPPALCNVGLSYSGLIQLGPPEAALSGLPTAFREGMLRRSALLGDDPEAFESAFTQPIDLWLWIQAREKAALSSLTDQVLKALAGCAECTYETSGNELLDEATGLPIEHFGFRDGISQPWVSGSLSAAQARNGVLDRQQRWRPLSTGEFLLGHSDETGEIPLERRPALAQLCHNGTFAVFRKLAQHVGEFSSYLQAESQRLQNAGITEATAAWIAERMVGRRQDGSPLCSSADGTISFADDHDGRICPLGAHVRRAHPRDGRADAGSFSRHRILRRSMPYGPRYTGDNAEAERGLLFVALNADIERQFEFLQQRYMNDGAAVRQGSQADPILSAAGGSFLIPGDAPSQRDTAICTNVPSFVTCRGGAYFLLPGLRALRWLARGAPTRHKADVRPRTERSTSQEQEPRAKQRAKQPRGKQPLQTPDPAREETSR